MYGTGVLLANRYRLDQPLGQGGMGEVWRATDQVLGRTVAVKVMRSQLVAQPGFAERFLAEARAMATVQHPYIVNIYDYQGDISQAFLVMELIEGEPLSDRLQRMGRLSPAATMALVAQTAEALQAAHDKGIVHRDVKPGNLLITPDDRVVLTDFGIARFDASAQLTATGQVIGTPSYLAPEQVLGRRATPSSDLYALGVVAYECLNGKLPFSGENSFAVATQRLTEPPAPMGPDVPPGVAAVVGRALASEPDERWPSALELAEAARAVAGTPSAPPPGASAPSVPNSAVMRPSAAADAAAAVPPPPPPMPQTDVTRPVQPTDVTRPVQQTAPTMRVPRDPDPTPPTRYQPQTPVQPAPTRQQTRQSPDMASPRPTTQRPAKQKQPPPPRDRSAEERSRPRRPKIMLVAGILLGLVAVCMAVFVGMLWSLRPDFVEAVDERIDGGTFDVLANVAPLLAWTAIGAYGFLMVMFALLAVLTAAGSRGARGWTYTFGFITLFIAAPLGVAAAFLYTRMDPTSPFRRELIALVPADYPDYATIAGVAAMGLVLVAMLLLMMPPVNAHLSGRGR